jgi:CO/xanthine dehydrogenase Mo-binding subunit
VIDIVTHENADKLQDAKLFSNGGYTSSTIQPLKSAEIAQEGQIVAVALAETFEAAREAAHAVKVNYIAALPTTTFDSPGDTTREPIGDKPYTSRSLMACFDEGAKAFGWANRKSQPKSMSDGDWLIGYGCATCYPTQMAPAAARVRLQRDGGSTDCRPSFGFQ